MPLIGLLLALGSTRRDVPPRVFPSEGEVPTEAHFIVYVPERFEVTDETGTPLTFELRPLDGSDQELIVHASDGQRIIVTFQDPRNRWPRYPLRFEFTARANWKPADRPAPTLGAPMLDGEMLTYWVRMNIDDEIERPIKVELANAVATDSYVTSTRGGVVSPTPTTLNEGHYWHPPRTVMIREWRADGTWGPRSNSVTYRVPYSTPDPAPLVILGIFSRNLGCCLAPIALLAVFQAVRLRRRAKSGGSIR